MALFDPGQVKEWIELLHGKSSGILHVCNPEDWTGLRFNPDDMESTLGYINRCESRKVSGIYLRTTTLSPGAPAGKGKRAGASHSSSLPGLWADIDIAGPGHKHAPNHPAMPEYNPKKATVFPLPGDEISAREIVLESGLLEPTLWVHSGGGVYPWWLLNDPENLAGDSFALDAAMKLSDGWQRILVAAAHRMRLDYGNVGDLARVMRIPGTVNRKAGLERPCRIIEQNGPRYSFESLASCLFDLQGREANRVLPASTPPPQPVPATPRATQTPRGPGSPLDALEQSASWEDILKPHGWEIHHESGGTTYWTRPGKYRSEGHSATTGHATDGRDRMWAFSTACGLPTNEPMTKPYVWGVLNGHGSNMKEVAKALVGAGFGTPISAPVGTTTRLAPIVSGTNGSTALATLRMPTAPQLQQVQPFPHSPEPPTWHPSPVRPGDAVPLPPFPLGSLPATMRDLVEHVAASRQVDPIMPALFALATVSAVSAGRIQVRRGGDWVEPLSFYVCPVAESGERKSPTGRAVFGVVDRIEHQMAAAWNDEVDRAVDELDQKRTEVRGNPAAANRVEDKLAALEASRKRPPRIKLSNDITPEALVRALAHQKGHGAVLDAEGTFMGILSGRYSNGIPNPELPIKAYDGDSYTADRISRDPDRIPRPTLALGLAVQRVVLDDAMGNKQLLERGMLARIVYGFPKSLVGSRWEANAAPYDPGPGRRWALVIEGINEITAPEDSDQVLNLVLSPQALAEHRTLSDQIEARLGAGGDLVAAGIKEWSHKHPGRVLRMAALLHLADGRGVSEEIGPEAMRGAIAIGEWAIAHARHAHRVDRESPEEATAKQCGQVLDWIGRAEKQAFTVREACRGVRAQWVSTKSMGDALDQLAELGWVKEQPYQDRAGRWRNRFAVSPYIGLARGAATM